MAREPGEREGVVIGRETALDRRLYWCEYASCESN